jgi:hypothetical protein
MDKIMVGDMVKVNPDKAWCNYTLYLEWFRFYKVREEKFEPFPLLREHIDVYDEDYIVKWIAPHLRRDKMLYAIEGIDTGRVFLIDRDVIAGYYHTENSTDCCYDVNERLLVQEIIRLNSEIDALKGEVVSLKEKAKKDEVNVETNPMPQLENGWFGFIRTYDEYGNIKEENKDDWFVVIKTEDKCSMIYRDGGADEFVSGDYAPFCFKSDGVITDEDGQVMGAIVYLCKTTCFDSAKYMYEHNLKTCSVNNKEIWRR